MINFDTQTVIGDTAHICPMSGRFFGCLEKVMISCPKSAFPSEPLVRHQLWRDLAMSWCIANVPCRNICLWNVCPPIKFVEFSCDQLSYILLAANFTCLILVVAHFSCWLWNWWDLDCDRNSINTCYLFVIYAPIKQRWRNKEHWFGGCSVLSDLKMEKELKLEGSLESNRLQRGWI